MLKGYYSRGVLIWGASAILMTLWVEECDFISLNSLVRPEGGKFLSRIRIWWVDVSSCISSPTHHEYSCPAGLVLYANSSCQSMSGLVALILSIISAQIWSLSTFETLNPHY